jgi:hypothetical protein
MSDENLDRAEELINMPGGPANPSPGGWYGSTRLLAMALDEVIKHLREHTDDSS